MEEVGGRVGGEGSGYGYLGSTEYLFSGSSIRKGWLFIELLISFKVAFNQTFLTSAGNLVTSAKVLGSGMKCDTYEPDSSKVINDFFNSYTTALKNLCKYFTILFAESSDPFHSLCASSIHSHILNILSSVLISGCIWIPSRMSSRSFVLIDSSSESSFVDNSSIEEKIDSYTSALHSYSTKTPSSNCAKVIMLLVCSWYYVSYIIYDPSGCKASAY